MLKVKDRIPLTLYGKSTVCGPPVQILNCTLGLGLLKNHHKDTYNFPPQRTHLINVTFLWCVNSAESLAGVEKSAGGVFMVYREEDSDAKQNYIHELLQTVNTKMNARISCFMWAEPMVADEGKSTAKPFYQEERAASAKWCRFKNRYKNTTETHGK